MELRDPMFESSYDSFIETTLPSGPRVHKLPENEVKNLVTYYRDFVLVSYMWVPRLEE